MKLKSLNTKTIVGIRNKILLMLGFAAVLSSGTACDDKKDTEPLPTEEVVSIHLNYATEDCYYFIPWKQQHGNYYLEFATGEIGYSGINAYPMNEGDYILCLDLYAEMDADHHNPTLPAGFYTPTQNPNEEHNLTFSLVNTMAIYNDGLAENGMSRVKFILFSTGTIDVERNEDGTYRFKGVFTGKNDDETYEFTFNGPIKIEDMSGIEDEDWWGFEGDTKFTAQKANYLYYDDSATKGVDNYILRLFETTNITPDYMHQNEPGNKVSLYLYAEHGKGLAGTYTVRESVEAGSCIPGEPMAAQAVGTFVERVREDLGVRYALITEGTVTITESAGNYNVTVNCKTREGASVQVTYRGSLENVTGKAPVYSTLGEDITVTPTVCSAVDYYGDFYDNGTVNYGVILENETERMCFDFISAAGTNYELPTGTFEINGTVDAGALLAGMVEDQEISPTCYVKYNADASAVIGYAPVKSGTLTITKSGSYYTFTFNVADDGQPAHTIRGTCTVTLPEFTDYTQQTQSAKAAKRKLSDRLSSVKIRTR